MISELVAALAAAGRVPDAAAGELVSAVIARERTGTTGFGKGVAVPHAKHARVPAITAALGVSGAGVDFDSFDGRPVHAVVLVLSPADQGQAHLDAMQSLFKTLQQEQFRRRLRECGTPGEILDLVSEH